MKFACPLALALASTLIGCGSTDNGDGSTTGDAVGTGNPDTGNPGDTTTISSTDNPCGLHTQYLGDDLCIPPPSPDEGIQIHVGPASYDDPNVVAPYLLAPGAETVDCFNAAIPQSDFYYLRQKNRMRPSSHHMLIFVEGGTGLTEGPSTACDLASGIGTIPGSQTPSRDFPDELGPEDAGLARYLPQSEMAAFQMHYINTTDQPVLREAWVNLYKTPAAEVTQRLQSIFFVGDLSVNVPPMTEQTTTLEFTASNLPAETRIFEVNAHMHAHSESFTLWRIHSGQDPELMYQSFDWEEPYENTFNSVVQNPLPDPVAQTDGGLSGLQYLEPGDTLRWACDVNNTTDAALRFRNEALTGEMCMLVGAYVGDTSGLLAGGCFGTQCSTGFFQ